MTAPVEVVVEVIASVVMLAGGVVMAIAAVGLLRFHDPAVRLHVAAKASSAGVLLVLCGAALRVENLGVATEFVLTGVFLVLSLPLATHALAAARHHDADARRYREGLGDDR